MLRRCSAGLDCEQDFAGLKLPEGVADARGFSDVFGKNSAVNKDGGREALQSLMCIDVHRTFSRTSSACIHAIGGIHKEIVVFSSRQLVGQIIKAEQINIF